MVKGFRKGVCRPAAGEKKLGVGSLRELIPYPPGGGGGWVADLSGIRLYSLFLADKNPMLYFSAPVCMK